MIVKNIYTELDCLLDTRLAFATLLDTDGTVEACKSGQYYLRTTDSIGNISGDVFNMLYEQRLNKLLTMALPTKLFKLIKDYYVETMTDPSHTVKSKVKNSILYINTHPYIFGDEEDEALAKLVEERIPGIDIELIRFDYKDLTCEWCNDKNIDVMFMYNGLHWLNEKTKCLEIINHNLTNVTIVSPLIKPNSMFDDNKSNLELSEYMGDIFKMLCNLNIIPVDEFSADLN